MSHRSVVAVLRKADNNFPGCRTLFSVWWTNIGTFPFCLPSVSVCVCVICGSLLTHLNALPFRGRGFIFDSQLDTFRLVVVNKKGTCSPNWTAVLFFQWENTRFMIHLWSCFSVLGQCVCVFGLGVEHKMYLRTGDWFHFLRAFCGAVFWRQFLFTMGDASVNESFGFFFKFIFLLF